MSHTSPRSASERGREAPSHDSPVPLLEARKLRKSFGHVEALRGADFEVHAGEVVAIIGDNGAGKSTLIKTLSGALQADSGEILFEGRSVAMSSPLDARALGIEVVYQDLALAPDLDAASNVYLGREIMRRGLLGKLGFMDQKAMQAEAAANFERMSVSVTTDTRPIVNYSGGQRQGVAIARSVMWANKVLFLDEPTAALAVIQVGKVLELIRRVADSGVGVVLISHDLPDVLKVADRIEVFRLGQRVAKFSRDDVTSDLLLAAMTGVYTNVESAK